MPRNRQVDEFLEAYRHLEAAAATLFPGDKKGGVIARLLRHPKFSQYREQLDCCRQVRNLLAHEVRVEGESPVLPGEGMVPFLEKMIALIEDPPRVRDRMTPRSRLTVTHKGAAVRPLMGQMRERDLSRVPVLEGEVVAGMFSLEAVFYACQEGLEITDATTVGDFAPYLPLDATPITSYRFVSLDTTIERAEKIFLGTYTRKSRLRALLVTQTGSPLEPLLGILSPYDVMG
ncbi:MAG: hypothetical protein IJC29_04550 [Clostridia bacterium]|nr:hypothetical protein [Clostridia bacterium]